MFAFASQIGATAPQKTRVDISILDLPSVSGTTRIDALSVAKIQQNKGARVAPNKLRNLERVENTAQTQRKLSQSVPNEAEPLKNTSNVRVAEKANTATVTPRARSQNAPNKVIPNEASKTTPLASDIVKAKESSNEKLAAIKSNTAITSNTQPEILSSSPNSTKTPTRQNNAIVIIKPDSDAQPAEVSTGRTTEKLTANNLVEAAAISNPDFTQAREPIESSKIATKVLANSTVLSSDAKLANPELLPASKFNLLTPPSNSARIQIRPAAVNTGKVKSVSSAKRIASKNPQTVTPTTMPKRAISSAKFNKLVARVAAKNPASTTPSKIKSISSTKRVASNSSQAIAPVKAVTINAGKIATISSVKRIASRKPQSIAQAKKPERAISSAKIDKQVARVVTQSAATRISTFKATQAPAKSPPASNNSIPNNQVAMIARPNKVPHELRAAPTKNQIEDFANVMDFLKYHRSENRCFLALPVVSNYERMELVGFSNDKSSWPRFQKAITQSTKFQIPGRLNSISDAQCQVLKFARENSLYPSFSVSMKLDQSEIENGTFVTGKLYINEGRYLNIYVVDDEGIAININRFVKIGTNTSSFKLQINLTGGKVSTSQLLFAIVTDKLLRSTRFPDPIAVNALLKNIKKEISGKKLRIDLAISAFLVK